MSALQICEYYHPVNGTMNQGIVYDASILKEPVLNRVGILAPLQTVAMVEESKMINFEDLKPTKGCRAEANE